MMTKTNLMFNVWIGNLNKYNCGELFGEWIDFLALDIDEINEKIEEICYNPELEEIEELDEFFIADYDCSFKHNFGEYENIEELKELADVLADLADEFGEYFDDITKAADYFGVDYRNIDADDFIIHYDCNDMYDVAYNYVNECGLLDSMPEHLQCYFDYNALARDMDIEGHFYQGANCMIEYIG